MNEQHIALSKFGYQVGYALENYKPHGLNISRFQNMVIGGLGGSGIGGQIAKAFYQTSLEIPVECIADYHLPAYAGEKTLVILASYSGNTEETISMFHEAMDRKCQIIILTSGGKLLDLAKTNQLPCYLIEQGFQPRMALGFSLTYLLLIIAELSGRNLTAELQEIIALLSEPKVYQDEAHAIFDSIKPKLKHKLIVLTDSFFQPIGIRFAQQIQENAKHECFQHSLPEMNHNVIESYYGQIESIFFMIDSHQNERISSRFDFLTNLLEVEYNKMIHIPVEEPNLKTVYGIIFMLDWLSLYIADFRKVDSLNVPNIMSLKGFLDQVS